jgi:HK97 family phage prohead protease
MGDKTDVKTKVERRFHRCPDIELRMGADDSPKILIGYAAVFDELSEDLGGFRERIAPSAFAGSLGGDVRALFNHDTNLILGRTKAKTLMVVEDQRGLRCEITLPETTVARDLLESVRVGNIDQMSFGFRTKKDNWEEVDGQIIRTLIDIELFDVSPVTFPAYPQTEIAQRSMGVWQEAINPTAPPGYEDELRKLALLDL